MYTFHLDISVSESGTPCLLLTVDHQSNSKQITFTSLLTEPVVMLVMDALKTPCFPCTQVNAILQHVTVVG